MPPRLVWKAHACYFRPQGGIWYRVYDGFFKDGRHHRRTPGRSEQPHRYFVPRDPAELRRIYVFHPDELRVVETGVLNLQLAKAKYFAGTKRTDAQMTDWREKIQPDTPDVVAGIRKRNAEKAGEPRKRR